MICYALFYWAGGIFEKGEIFMCDKGLVFNIQKFSIHDGPGIRTIVFLKGCPLHCRWCANPEGIRPVPQIAQKNAQCIGVNECGYCIEACKQQAIYIEDNKAVIDFSKCNDCLACEVACPANIFEQFGKRMSVDEVIQEVLKDQAFYIRSGGGLTLSGGEPLLQADFAGALLKAARAEGLETAIETCGFAPWENIEKVFPWLDFVHFDIKSMNDEKHIAFTGQSNQLILENFEKICHTYTDVPILVRTPVIPGFNDTVEDIQAIADHIQKVAADCSNVNYELLPFHCLADSKYTSIGQTYAYHDYKNMEKSVVQSLIDHVNFSKEIILK